MKVLKKTAFLVLIVSAMVLSFALAACGSNPLLDAVDGINSDESLHKALEGLYTVRAEARGDSTIVVILRAERNELADPEVAKSVSDSAAPEFQNSVRSMREARIHDPIIILEFLDMGGNLIYSREFS